MEWETPVQWGRFLLFCVHQSVKTKETYPTRPGFPTPCKQALFLYMLINGRHTHCLHVPFLFHWQIYGQQPSSTSSPRDKRKKAEWTSKKQTSVDDVKNKTSILNRITIVFHHCLFNLNISVETNYVWVWWFVWNTRSFPQRSYLEKCVSNTISPVLQSTARCLLEKNCHVHELLSRQYSFLFLKTSRHRPPYWIQERFTRLALGNIDWSQIVSFSKITWRTT